MLSIRSSSVFCAPWLSYSSNCSKIRICGAISDPQRRFQDSAESRRVGRVQDLFLGSKVDQAKPWKRQRCTKLHTRKVCPMAAIRSKPNVDYQANWRNSLAWNLWKKGQVSELLYWAWGQCLRLPIFFCEAKWLEEMGYDKAQGLTRFLWQQPLLWRLFARLGKSPEATNLPRCWNYPSTLW